MSRRTPRRSALRWASATSEQRQEVAAAEAALVLHDDQVAPGLGADEHRRDHVTVQHACGGQRADDEGAAAGVGGERLLDLWAVGVRWLEQLRRDAIVRAGRDGGGEPVAVGAVDRTRLAEQLGQRAEQLGQRLTRQDEVAEALVDGGRATQRLDLALLGIELRSHVGPRLAVHDRNRRQLGEGGRDVGVLRGELVGPVDVVEEHDADHLALEDHGHRHDRADLPEPHRGLDRPRIAPRVADDHGTLRPQELGGDAVGRHAGQRALDVGAEVLRARMADAAAEHARGLVAQVDAAPLDAHQLADLARDDLQQRIHVGAVFYGGGDACVRGDRAAQSGRARGRVTGTGHPVRWATVPFERDVHFDPPPAEPAAEPRPE
jgi:hypothetical protein